MKSDMIPKDPPDDLILCEHDPIKGSAEDGDGIDSIIAFIDAAVTAGEAYRGADGTFDDVVTLADLDPDIASGTIGTSTPASSSVSWSQVTRHNDEHGSLFDRASVDHDPRSWDLAVIVSDFIKQCDPVMIVHLLRRHDAEETICFLADPFLDYFSSHYRHRQGSFDTPAFTKEQAYYACLDLMIRGFDQLDGISASGFGVHHIARARRFARDKAREFIKERDDELQDVAHSVYLDHCKLFTSPTFVKQSDRRLLPVEKARVFMNALKERKDAGSLITTDIRTRDGQLFAVGMNYKPLVIFYHDDQARIQELFEHYRSMTVRDLLVIFDRCLEVHIEDECKGIVPGHKAFHANKGRIVAFFGSHVETIAEELKTRFSYNYPGLLRT